MRDVCTVCLQFTLIHFRLFGPKTSLNFMKLESAVKGVLALISFTQAIFLFHWREHSDECDSSRLVGFFPLLFASTLRVLGQKKGTGFI